MVYGKAVQYFQAECHTIDFIKAVNNTTEKILDSVRFESLGFLTPQNKQQLTIVFAMSTAVSRLGIIQVCHKHVDNGCHHPFTP